MILSECNGVSWLKMQGSHVDSETLLHNTTRGSIAKSELLNLPLSFIFICVLLQSLKRRGVGVDGFARRSPAC
jgi:hypothetical protein